MPRQRTDTKGERRDEKKRFKMKVSGKSFVNAVRNAITKRKDKK